MTFAFHQFSQMNQDYLSLKEAAVIAKVSKVTLWRSVQKGDLVAIMDEKNRYMLERETLQKWCETFQGETAKRFTKTSETTEIPRETFHEEDETECNASEEPPETTETFHGKVYETVEMVSADLHLVALETTRHALESARRAEERAERTDRRLEALTGAVSQYQMVLGERAESLAEKDAMVLAAQALAEENARKLEEFEAEKAALVERLKMSENRVDWLEKRVPRWVRSLFRAG